MKLALHNLWVPILAGTLLLGNLAVANAQQQPQADNTRVNRQEQPTADKQKENRSDREITQQIRKAIANDKSLSTDAHNIKIITQNGLVTLRGPVRSEEERKAVEVKATEVAGQENVTNQLEVKSKD